MGAHSAGYDIVDLVGGPRYELAEHKEIFHFHRECGFALTKLKCVVGLGCNELVLARERKSHFWKLAPNDLLLQSRFF